MKKQTISQRYVTVVKTSYTLEQVIHSLPLTCTPTCTLLIHTHTQTLPHFIHTQRLTQMILTEHYTHTHPTTHTHTLTHTHSSPSPSSPPSPPSSPHSNKPSTTTLSRSPRIVPQSHVTQAPPPVLADKCMRICSVRTPPLLSSKSSHHC